VSLPGPLRAMQSIVLHDFSAIVNGLTPVYVMDLYTDEGGDPRNVRIPISSWQATIQTGRQSYAQCVTPACEDYVDIINAGASFSVLRQATLPDGYVFEYQMFDSPISTTAIAQGTSNYTATISGYSTAVPEDEDPPDAYLRTLVDIRTITSQASGVRVRCGIDWLLRPAWRAQANDDPFIVSYINYYASDGDQYMDVGERIELV
jgi:hypothetical protein